MAHHASNVYFQRSSFVSGRIFISYFCFLWSYRLGFFSPISWINVANMLFGEILF